MQTPGSVSAPGRQSHALSLCAGQYLAGVLCRHARGQFLKTVRWNSQPPQCTQKCHMGAATKQRPDNAQGGIETHALLTVRGGVHCAFSTHEKSLMSIFTAYRIHRKLSVEICLGVEAGQGGHSVHDVSTTRRALLWAWGPHWELGVHSWGCWLPLQRQDRSGRQNINK